MTNAVDAFLAHALAVVRDCQLLIHERDKAARRPEGMPSQDGTGHVTKDATLRQAARMDQNGALTDAAATELPDVAGDILDLRGILFLAINNLTLDLEEFNRAYRAIEVAKYSNAESPADSGQENGQQKKTSIKLPENPWVTQAANYVRQHEDAGSSLKGLVHEFCESKGQNTDTIYHQLLKRFRHLLDGTRFEKQADSGQ